MAAGSELRGAASAAKQLKTQLAFIIHSKGLDARAARQVQKL